MLSKPIGIMHFKIIDNKYIISENSRINIFINKCLGSLTNNFKTFIELIHEFSF